MSDDREAGLVGGAEGLVFGFFLFVIGTLVVVNAWAVIDAKVAVTAAAREAARAFVEASHEADAWSAADRAAREAMAGHGREASTARFRLDLDGARLARCARVTAVARYDVSLAGIPMLGVTRRAFTVSARHSEVVDPYRSGDVRGTAVCMP